MNGFDEGFEVSHTVSNGKSGTTVFGANNQEKQHQQQKVTNLSFLSLLN